MEREEILRESLEMIESLHVAYLSTVDEDGYPQTRAVFNLRCPGRFPHIGPLFRGHEGDFLTYFTTNASSLKVRQMRRHPKVSAYFCRLEDSFGVLLTGLGEVAGRATRDACWQDGWRRYYPGGPEDPEYAILRLLPERIAGWIHHHRFSFRLVDPAVDRAAERPASRGRDRADAGP